LYYLIAARARVGRTMISSGEKLHGGQKNYRLVYSSDVLSKENIFGLIWQVYGKKECSQFEDALMGVFDEKICHA
jgi:hypothetical protein